MFFTEKAHIIVIFCDIYVMADFFWFSEQFALKTVILDAKTA